METALRTETFTVGSSTFRLAPENGFRLMTWSLRTSAGIREVLHWPQDPAGRPFPNIRGGNPLLFPFAGRSYDRGVEEAWKAPDGQRRPMPQHAFARQGRFQILEQGEAEIRGRLMPDAAAQEAYPYAYAFEVAYLFKELSLEVTFFLENHGAAPLPWSAGHHFYFNLPWHRGATRADYQLNMEARKGACQGPDGKLVAIHNRETCHDFSDTDLTDRIHWALRHNRVSFGPKGGGEDIHLIIGKDPVPPASTSIVTWAESESAPYYCVEPWMGPPNAAEHGKGLHWVHPGERGVFAVELSLY